MGALLARLYPTDVAKIGLLLCARQESPCPWVTDSVAQDLWSRPRSWAATRWGAVCGCAISPSGVAGDQQKALLASRTLRSLVFGQHNLRPVLAAFLDAF
eukprot:RCo000332